MNERILTHRISSRHFCERLTEMCRTDPAVRVLSWILGPDRLLEWAHSVGVVKHPELAACVPPIPPLELRGITAASAAEEFLWTGLVDLAQFLAIGERVRANPTERHLRILDFGCGCGRMTRHLNNIEGIDAYGIDINPELVSWCQKALPGVRTFASPEAAPMPLPDDFFDVAYSLSVFTHLPADRSQGWLHDIARVLASGGGFIATTQGYRALEVIQTSPLHQQMFGLNERATHNLVARLEAEQFLFIPYRENVLKAAKATSSYGNAFIHEHYIAQHWAHAGFEVLEYLPGGLRDWQDIVVLLRN
jgi:ubiquinone/menaquinone biosynthesis C-methylase UbiE